MNETIPHLNNKIAKKDLKQLKVIIYTNKCLNIYLVLCIIEP